jgi:hypothetical protein
MFILTTADNNHRSPTIPQDFFSIYIAYLFYHEWNFV